MPLVSITNLTSGPLAIDAFTIMAAGTTQVHQLSTFVFEQVREGYAALQTLGRIRWVILQDAPAAESTGSLLLYVDDTLGDDDNIGTASRPLKTLTAAFRKVPSRVLHPVVINVAPGSVEMPEVIGPYTLSAPIVVQATSFTEILTGTCQAGTGDLAIVVLGGLTLDEHFGRTIEVTDPATGRVWRRTINSNDGVDTIVPNYSFFGAAVDGASFRILENATTLQLHWDGIPLNFNAKEISRIKSVGSCLGNPFGANPAVMAEAIVFAGINFEGPGYFLIEDSTVVLYGCNFVGALPVMRIITDERSLVMGGMDYDASSRATLPHIAGVLDPAAPDCRQWLGWGVFSDSSASDAQLHTLARFIGFLSSNDLVRLQEAKWQLFGGRIISAREGLMASSRSTVEISMHLSDAAPYTIESTMDGTLAATVDVSGGSVVHLGRGVVIKKTNQGYGVLAYSWDDVRQLLPGFVSLGEGVTLEGVSGTTNALCVAFGARIYFKFSPIIVGSWGAGVSDEAAVRPDPLTTTAPIATSQLSALSTSGDAIPPAAAGIDGRHGFIQNVKY